MLQRRAERERDARRTAASSAPAATGRAIVLLDNPLWPEYARRDIAAIAAERGQDPLEAVCDLLLARGRRPRHG